MSVLKRQRDPCADCPLATQCKDHLLACAEFWAFVEKSDAPIPARKSVKAGRLPTRQVYDYIFCGIDKEFTGRFNSRGRPIMIDPPELRSLRRAAVRSIALVRTGKGGGR